MVVGERPRRNSNNSNRHRSPKGGCNSRGKQLKSRLGLSSPENDWLNGGESPHYFLKREMKNDRFKNRNYK
jgi:hypothetical protein